MITQPKDLVQRRLAAETQRGVNNNTVSYPHFFFTFLSF